MILALKTVEWTQMAAAVGAAFAATASWMAVRQSRRAFEASQMPQMDGQWLPREDGAATLQIYNTGRGFAREPHFYVVSGGAQAGGRALTTGPLRPGMSVSLRAELPPQAAGTAVVGVLFCLDWAGRWHVWSWDGRRARPHNWRGRSPRLLDPREALRLLYPREAQVERASAPWSVLGGEETFREAAVVY